MDEQQIDTHEGDRPQWLGSLARRAKARATETAAPTFTQTNGARWLGSVARRNAEVGAEIEEPAEAPTVPEPEGSGSWNGSSVRSAVFSQPPRLVEPPAPPVQQLPGAGRVVVGELGMTIRAA